MNYADEMLLNGARITYLRHTLTARKYISVAAPSSGRVRALEVACTTNSSNFSNSIQFQQSHRIACMLLKVVVPLWVLTMLILLRWRQMFMSESHPNCGHSFVLNTVI